MGIYRRPDSPTWWMSLQLNGQRVRLNTMVEDRQLAEEFFCAWKTEIARARWLGAPTPDGDHTVAELITQYFKMVRLESHRAPNSVIASSWRGSPRGGGNCC